MLSRLCIQYAVSFYCPDIYYPEPVAIVPTKSEMHKENALAFQSCKKHV